MGTPPDLAPDLRRAHAVIAHGIRALEALPVKRKGRLARRDLILDLDCELGKIRDTLAVYGLGDPGERPGSAMAALEGDGVKWGDRA